MRYTVTMGRQRVFAPSANGALSPGGGAHGSAYLLRRIAGRRGGGVPCPPGTSCGRWTKNAGSAMKQIGTHLSTRFDAVLALLEVAQGYAGDSMAALAGAAAAAPQGRWTHPPGRRTCGSRSSCWTMCWPPCPPRRIAIPDCGRTRRTAGCSARRTAASRCCEPAAFIQRRGDAAEPGGADVSHLADGAAVRHGAAGALGGVKQRYILSRRYMAYGEDKQRAGRKARFSGCRKKPPAFFDSLKECRYFCSRLAARK